jgi:hypothetical protein
MMTRIAVALVLALSFAAATELASPLSARAEDAPRANRTVEIGVPDMT